MLCTDEVVPGNALLSDNARRSYALYLTWRRIQANNSQRVFLDRALRHQAKLKEISGQTARKEPYDRGYKPCSY